MTLLILVLKATADICPSRFLLPAASANLRKCRRPAFATTARRTAGQPPTYKCPKGLHDCVHVHVQAAGHAQLAYTTAFGRLWQDLRLVREHEHMGRAMWTRGGNIQADPSLSLAPRFWHHDTHGTGDYCHGGSGRVLRGRRPRSGRRRSAQSASPAGGVAARARPGLRHVQRMRPCS
jgi:hypothetical protein